MGAVSRHGDAGRVDGFDGSHGIAFDAGDLDESANGVTGEPEVMFHTYFCGIFHLMGGAAEVVDECAGSHGAGDANFALASDIGTGNGGVSFVEHGDGAGGEEKPVDAGALTVGALFKSGGVVEDGREDASGPVGGGCDDASASGIFFVDG